MYNLMIKFLPSTCIFLQVHVYTVPVYLLTSLIILLDTIDILSAVNCTEYSTSFNQATPTLYLLSSTYIMRRGEREREREREAGKGERERQRDRERDRETERQRERETERERDRERERETERERDRETERDRERQRETERDRDRERQNIKHFG